jgi:CoA:oxalate CoA-transferase
MKQFAAATGMPGLETDPRFATPRARRDNNEALRDLIEAWLQSFSSRAEAIATLERHRVPCAPVLNLAEAIAHPHLRARRTVRRVKDSHLGEFDITGMPAKFSLWPEHENLKADLLGEHNEQILSEILGCSQEEITALYREGAIVRDPCLEREMSDA